MAIGRIVDTTGAVSNIRYADSVNIPQTAGTYAVTFDVAEAAGWNAASGLSAGTLTVNPIIDPRTVWARTVSVGNSSSIFNSVAVDSSSNVYAVGTQYGTGTVNYGNDVVQHSCRC